MRTLQYLHHAKAIINKPYHTGFFFKIWDQLFGSIYTGECACCKSVVRTRLPLLAVRAHGLHGRCVLVCARVWCVRASGCVIGFVFSPWCYAVSVWMFCVKKK